MYQLRRRNVITVYNKHCTNARCCPLQTHSCTDTHVGTTGLPPQEARARECGWAAGTPCQVKRLDHQATEQQPQRPPQHRLQTGHRAEPGVTSVFWPESKPSPEPDISLPAWDQVGPPGPRTKENLNGGQRPFPRCFLLPAGCIFSFSFHTPFSPGPLLLYPFLFPFFFLFLL